MQRRTVPLLVLTAVVAAAVAVLAFGGREAPPAPPGVGAESDPVPPRAAPTPVPVPVGAPHVHVAVRTEAAFVPPPLPRVRAALGATGPELPVALVAGEGAGFDPPPARAGTALVAVTLDGGRQVLRQVALPADGVADCRVGARVVARGRVADDRGVPLRDARVWLGEVDATGARVEFVTDASGEWAGDVPAGDGVPVVVAAAGRASRWQGCTAVPPGLELATVLQPGRQLEVQLAVAADDLAAARLFVVPTSAVATGLAEWPFFAQALDDGFAVDRAGRAVVAGLPPDGEVGLLVRHPLLAGMAPQRVNLRDPNARAIVPVELAAARVQGRVVDEAGAPLAGVVVWARRPGQALDAPGTARLLPPQLPVRGTVTAVSAADGTFVLAAPAAADAILSLRAQGHAGLDVPLANRVAGDLVLPAWRGGEPSFVLLPPAAGAAWSASCDLAAGITAGCAADTPWQVSLPHPGRYTFVVTTRIGSADGNERTFAGVAVTGPFELAPLPAR
ncbi:MAG: hypothetical protein JNL08_04945 [Planctomycetes bacterium]|nr:hypothetical protein [Planctomycetota bacterium]